MVPEAGLPISAAHQGPRPLTIPHPLFRCPQPPSFHTHNPQPHPPTTVLTRHPRLHPRAGISRPPVHGVGAPLFMKMVRSRDVLGRSSASSLRLTTLDVVYDFNHNPDAACIRPACRRCKSFQSVSPSPTSLPQGL